MRAHTPTQTVEHAVDQLQRVKHVGPRFPYTSLILRTTLRPGLATGSCGFKAFVSMSDKCVLLENKNVMSLITNTVMFVVFLLLRLGALLALALRDPFG